MAQSETVERSNLFIHLPRQNPIQLPLLNPLTEKPESSEHSANYNAEIPVKEYSVYFSEP